MINILVIGNEPFLDMALGTNGTLSHILSHAKSGNEVYYVDLNIFKKDYLKINNEEKFLEFLKKNLLKNSLLISKKQEFVEKLIEKYQQKNYEIYKKTKNFCKTSNIEKLLKIKRELVSDYLDKKLNFKSNIQLQDINFVIQRIEPMKFPFYPAGTIEVNKFLNILKEIFPNKKFNTPIINDKELPILIEKLAIKKKLVKNNKNYSIPTYSFTLEDDEEKISKIVSLAKKKYLKLYENGSKIVLKPSNSAQSVGVFSIDFSRNDTDFINSTISQIINQQIFGIYEKNIGKIIRILLFVEYLKTNQSQFDKFKDVKIKDLFDKEKEIKELSKNLYNEEILVQPFIEGVSKGDIRVNFIKNINGDFVLAGKVFRKNLTDDKNFTTCYSQGKAIPLPLKYYKDKKYRYNIFKNEFNDLDTKINILLNILNDQLKDRYDNMLELGADFIIVGDKKDIMLNEINHFCPGLMPLSEIMNEIENNKSLKYEHGLGYPLLPQITNSN